MSEEIDRMKEWFGRALGAADFDLRLQDKEKGSSWKEATPLSLFNKMMGHVNLMMNSGFEKVVIDTRDGPMPGIEEKTTVNLRTDRVHAIKAVNYALMIATRLADESSPLSDIELEDVNLAEEERAKGEMPVFDSAEELIEAVEAEPEAKSESEEYYCPWCEHKSKMASGCHGKICCIKCGKPINSRMGKLLKKARENYHVESKMAVNAQELAQDLGTTASWAGQVMRALGWTRNANYSGRVSTWYTPPKEDGKILLAATPGC